MTDLVQGAEKVVGASTASGVATVVEDVTGGAAKLAFGAVGGLLTGAVPYVCGVLGVAILGLGATVFWDRHVTIPRLLAQDAIDKGAVASANAATTECNASQDALRITVQQQNQQIAALQAHADTAAQKAEAAAASVILKPLPAPPVDKSAAAVNAYLRSLRVSP
jgi:hypothetical protein